MTRKVLLFAINRVALWITARFLFPISIRDKNIPAWIGLVVIQILTNTAWISGREEVFWTPGCSELQTGARRRLPVSSDNVFVRAKMEGTAATSPEIPVCEDWGDADDEESRQSR